MCQLWKIRCIKQACEFARNSTIHFFKEQCGFWLNCHSVKKEYTWNMTNDILFQIWEEKTLPQSNVNHMQSQSDTSGASCFGHYVHFSPCHVTPTLPPRPPNILINRSHPPWSTGINLCECQRNAGYIQRLWHSRRTPEHCTTIGKIRVSIAMLLYILKRPIQLSLHFVVLRCEPFHVGTSSSRPLNTP